MPEITYTDADGKERYETLIKVEQDSVRDARGLLVQTDWTQLADTPEDVKSVFALYRAELQSIIDKRETSAILPPHPRSIYRFE